MSSAMSSASSAKDWFVVPFRSIWPRSLSSGVSALSVHQTLSWTDTAAVGTASSSPLCSRAAPLHRHRLEARSSIALRVLRRKRFMTTPASAHCATSQRSMTSLSAAVPHVCRSLAEAHLYAGERLNALLHERVCAWRASSQATPHVPLHEVLELTADWWDSMNRELFLPRDVFSVDDLPLYLLEAVKGGGPATVAHTDSDTSDRFARMSEEDVVNEFDEWVLMYAPPATTQHEVAPDSPPGSAPASGMNSPPPLLQSLLPYTTLIDLVQSYVRYHRGVRWGASDETTNSDARGDAAAARRALGTYYRQLYYLHPWHGVYCPGNGGAQMPYVRVLQWMLEGEKNSSSSGKDTAQGPLHSGWSTRHHALEPFVPPSLKESHGGECGFSALDLCCQSGFGVDLLLKAGASTVVAIDTSDTALASTEATVREHLRDKRSTARGGGQDGSQRRKRVVQVQRCSLLPNPGVFPLLRPTDDRTSATASSSSSKRQPGATSTTAAPSMAAASSVFASAASRRRQTAQRRGRGYAAASDGASDLYSSPSQSDVHEQVPALGRAGGDRRGAAGGVVFPGPFDVLYFHPPMALSPFPVGTLASSAVPSPSSVWWRQVRARARREAERSVSPVLPFVPCSAFSQHPHASLHALQQLVQSLIEDATVRYTRPPPPEVLQSGLALGASARQSRGVPRALLMDDGYVVFVLPRSFDPIESACSDDSGALSDWVVAQLDGYYDVVLRRREWPAASRSEEESARLIDPLMRYVLRTIDEGVPQPRSLLASNTVSLGAQLLRELLDAQRTKMWVDVLVLKKSKSASLLAHATRLQRAQEDQRNTGGTAHTYSTHALQAWSAGRASTAAATSAGWDRTNTTRLAELEQLMRALDRGRGSDAPGWGGSDSDDQCNGVQWEDSFEFNEYKPKDGNGSTRYHWTDLIPSYSYLEKDFYEQPAKVRGNFIAVGHPPAIQATSTPTSLAASSSTTTTRASVQQRTGNQKAAELRASQAARAASDFRSVFAQELRTRRRRKMRKLALSPLEQQEWYINEKLIRSEASKVELANELARLDLKDYE